MKKKRLLAILATAGVALAGAAAAIVPMTASNAAEACAGGYNNNAVYTNGMKVSHQGKNWTAKWWTQYEAPSNGGSGVWADNGACGGGGGTNPPPIGGGNGGNVPNWSADADYNPGDVVRYTNGQCYRAKHANPGYDPVISTWFWEPTACSGGGNPNPPPPPPPGNPGSFPVTEAQFNQMFPGRNQFYTYAGLVNATGKYSAFASGGRGKLEAVAFLANISHESGGLVHVREINRGNYCDLSQSYGCPAGQGEYYGRGPIQLSWNFNYRAAGHALGMGDELLRNPDRVATDPSIAFQTAIWYWMTQSGPGSQPAHSAIHAGNFGGTIAAINGALECGGRNPAQVESRIRNLRDYARIAGVDLNGVNLYC